MAGEVSFVLVCELVEDGWPLGALVGLLAKRAMSLAISPNAIAY